MRIARSLKLWTALFIISVPFLFSLRAEAVPRLVIRVIDTLAIPGDTGYLGVYMTNPLDTVSGFELTLLVDKPNLIGFIPSFDSSNTLVYNWEYLTAQLVTTPQTGIKFFGFATVNPPVKPGIAPASSPRLLLKVPFFARVIPDSVTDRTATISITPDVNDFGFASKQGQSIGLVSDTLYDSTCYQCTRRDVEGNCLVYGPGTPPCDSISITKTLINPHIDTSIVSLLSGSVTLLANCHPLPLAGDVDANGKVDSADLSALRAFVQYGTTTLPRPNNADLNQDCCISWADYAVLDLYLRSAPGTVTLPSCGCANPVRCCCIGRRGNLNNDQFDVIDISDLSYMVAYLTGGVATLPCWPKADFDGNGIVDLADLSRLVSFLTGGGLPPGLCS